MYLDYLVLVVMNLNSTLYNFILYSSLSCILVLLFLGFFKHLCYLNYLFLVLYLINQFFTNLVNQGMSHCMKTSNNLYDW
jgi:hypothetical protein